MSKKRVLFVTQEMNPYTTLSEISELVRKLPQHVQESGFEIRILMPKFGTINERRHRLHEVVRLSGMNIIVDDEDYPLIIKVASLPKAKMQVYFMDNEEFFKRKKVFKDEEGIPFADNQNRTVFFCKSVMEIVKKFGWVPDIIHCHGPMASLVPVYNKLVYHTDPIFQQAQMIYSVYNSDLDSSFDENFLDLAAINELEEEDLEMFLHDGKINLHKGAISCSDTLVIGSEDLAPETQKLVEDSKLPVLGYEEIDTQVESIVNLYDSLTEDDDIEDED